MRTTSTPVRPRPARATPGVHNYLPSNDSQTFTISKATPALSVTNSPVTYNGSPQAATSPVGSTPGTVSAIKYDGSATVPANAATYAVTADFTPDDPANYNSLSGARQHLRHR